MTDFHIAATTQKDLPEGKWNSPSQNMHTEIPGVGHVVRMQGNSHKASKEPSEDSCLLASGFSPALSRAEGEKFLKEVFRQAHEKSKIVGDGSGAVMAAALRTQEGICWRLAGDVHIFMVTWEGKVELLTTDQAAQRGHVENGIGDSFDHERRNDADDLHDARGNIPFGGKHDSHAILIIASDGLTHFLSHYYNRFYPELEPVVSFEEVRRLAQQQHLQEAVDTLCQQGIEPLTSGFSVALAKMKNQGKSDDIGIVAIPIGSPDSPPALAVVCDGMGGHAHGNKVSQNAIAAIAELVREKAKNQNISTPPVEADFKSI